MLSWQKERKSKSKPSCHQWLARVGPWQGKLLPKHLLPAQIFPLWWHWHSFAWGCLHVGLTANRGEREAGLLMGPPSYPWPHSMHRVEEDKAGKHSETWRFANLYLRTGLKGFMKVSQQTAMQKGAGKKVVGDLHPTFLMNNYFKTQRVWKGKKKRVQSNLRVGWEGCKGKKYLQFGKQKASANSICYKISPKRLQMLLSSRFKATACSKTTGACRRSWNQARTIRYSQAIRISLSTKTRARWKIQFL